MDNDQQLIKIVPDNGAISILQTQELPEDGSLLKDMLSVHLKNDERLFDAQYMAIKSYDGNRNSFDMYRIVDELVPDNATEFEGVQVAPYELEGVVVEDLRPQGWTIERTTNQILKDSDWRLGYVDDNLPTVTTNFYYLSAKDSLKKLQELTGVEFTFKVEISGNKITDKWVEVYRELGNRTLKRFNYGTNALTVKRETSHSELYTALIGRGKGEEVGETDAGDATYGRKINFADVEWKKSAGKPVDKPKGQKYIELPQATAEFGIKLLDGRKVPRIGMVEFSDTEEPEVLIEQTWQALQEYARPKVLFSATVANIGDTGIGDTVTIHRHDLNMHYKTRVRKVMRNRKNNDKTQVEIGDVVYTASTKRQVNINSQLNNMQNDLSNVKGEVSHVVTSADGKNNITYSNVEPERKKVGDSWVRDHPSLAGETQWLVWNGEAWELILDTSETTLNKEAIESAQQDIAEAQQTADEAVEQIDTAVANAGFTSLDDTLQNMNDITMNAEQSAQQAITDASNAYGLAQTSISEAQTAQANSLTALGKAANALDGVSSLDVRVDDVEAELELKADNTYMTEDGTLTTLSNAITFNANRFSSDMSRIESRVESLAGEVNLVILRNAFENTWLLGGEVYPNATANTGTDTMSEMINVVAGEELALSKNTVDGDNTWRISFYDNSHNYVTRATTSTNQYILTVPAGATKMWVSYPTGSQPQIVRGTDFIPYRPNLADQMTTEEINIFRNEYDEFADRTERRLTAVDSSGGRLDVAENLITQNTNGLTLKADQSTVDTLAGTVQSLGTEFDVVAGQVNSRVWNTDIETAIDGIEVGGRNLLLDSKPLIVNDRDYLIRRFKISSNKLNTGENITISINGEIPEEKEGFRFYNSSASGAAYIGYVEKSDFDGGNYASKTFRWREHGDNNELWVYAYPNLDNTGADIEWIKLERGTKATDWTPAPEDTDAKIDHIETEWTQTFDSFSQTVAGIDGRVTSQKQTIDSITRTVTDHTGKIATVEQNVHGIQQTVSDPVNGLVTQVSTLANGFNVLASDFENAGNLLEDSDKGTGRNSNYHQKKYKISEPIEDGETVTLSIKAYTGSIYQDIRIFSEYTDSSLKIFEPRASVKTDIYHITFTWTNRGADIDNPYLNIYIGPKDNTNNREVYWAVLQRGTRGINSWVANDMATQAQLSVLNDNINLRVEKGDVINQINISDENILIQANKIMALGDVVVDGKLTITDEFIAPGITADKITSGTLDAAKARIINLDFDTAVGNRTQFVQSAWNNAVGGNVSISGSGIVTTASNGAQGLIQNGVFLSRQPNGSTLGYIGYGQPGSDNRPFYTINLSQGAHFRTRHHLGSENYKHGLLINAGAEYAEFNINRVHFNQQITLGNNANHAIASRDLYRLNIIGNESVGIGGNNRTVLAVSASSGVGYATFFANLNMNGYYINNAAGYNLRSERKYKTNIIPLEHAMETVEQLKIYSYDKRGEDGQLVPELGIIVDEAPECVIGLDGKTVDMYSYISLIGKTQQELIAMVKEMREEITELKGMVT